MVCISSQISWLQDRKCLALFPKHLPEEDVVLQVVILGLLPVTLSEFAVLPGLTEQVTLVPVPISSGSSLLASASRRTGAVQRVTRGAASCSDRALNYRLRTLKALSQQIPLAQDPAMSSS